MSERKERGLIFQPWGIRALLAGRKTVTRRICKFIPRVPGIKLNASSLKAGLYHTGVPLGPWVLRSMGGSCWNDRTQPLKCPYGVVGEFIYAKETWAPNYTGSFGDVHYRADLPTDPDKAMTENHAFGLMKWKSSMFMPRKYARIVREIVSVRAERPQDITEEDCIAEGIWSEWEALYTGGGSDVYYWGSRERGDLGGGFDTAKQAYACLWDSINDKPQYVKGAGFGGTTLKFQPEHAYRHNPWVWRIEFSRENAVGF